MYNIIVRCGSGGTGRRARLRGVWFYRTGSIPVSRTRKRLRIGYNSESFSTKPTLTGGINRIHDEIPRAWDEIRLDGGWVDLISSKLGLDFICHRQISSRSDFIHEVDLFRRRRI